MLAPSLGTAAFRILGGPATTVSVIGTSLSATVGSDGSFTISGLPLGDVILQFNVSGTAARITVSSVVENEHIQLTVSVSGATATVVTIQRVPSDSKTELEGAVTALAGGCPAVTFTVNGTTILTSVSTEFTGAGCSAVRTGAKVEVKGTRQANGSVLALKVNVDTQTVEIQPIEFEGTVSAAAGTCPVITFTAKATTIVTSAATQFTGAGCSAVRTGAKVEVKGTRQTNGSVLALKVNVEVEEIEIEGKVVSTAGTCPALTFSVNGTSIRVGAATQYKGGSCGSIKTGQKVGVKGTRQADGSVFASKVEIDD